MGESGYAGGKHLHPTSQPIQVRFKGQNNPLQIKLKPFVCHWVKSDQTDESNGSFCEQQYDPLKLNYI